MLELYASNGGKAAAVSRRLLTYALQVRGIEGVPALGRAPGGKPCFSEHRDLHFNLSHSGPYALCAVSDAPVGVDIEAVRPRRESLLRVLSQTELDWFQARGSRWEDFYCLWTLKESLCKQSGRGLDRRPEQIRVPLLGPGEAAFSSGLFFRTWGGEGWRAAVCSGGQIEGDICWR